MKKKMNIYPAIDLQSGKCVRLYQGRFDQVTEYDNDPILLAKSYRAQGAEFLHVVDLDGAKSGVSVNNELILKLVSESGLKIQTGGGIRTQQQVSALLKAKVERVVLGSIAVSDPITVKSMLKTFGAERIVLALDVRINDLNEPMVAVQGWQTNSQKNLWEILAEYQNVALKHVICTDISRDGTLQGANLSLYQQCVQRYPDLQFQASGGVQSLQDLIALAAIPVDGVIIGKALYNNQFTLSAALAIEEM